MKFHGSVFLFTILLNGCFLLGFDNGNDAGAGPNGEADGIDKVYDDDVVEDAGGGATSSGSGGDSDAEAGTVLEEAGVDAEAGTDECEPNSITCESGVAVVCDEFGFELSREHCNDKANECNGGVCIEDTGCVRVPLEGDVVCGEGLYCNAPGTCNVGVCELGDPRDCSGLTDVCAVGVCDEDQDKCDVAPVSGDVACGAGALCIAGACRGTCEGDQCAVTCDPNLRRCQLMCGASANCSPTCGLASTCDIDCGVGGVCNTNCTNGSSCDVICTTAACAVYCSATASCLLDCSQATSECFFADCEQGATTCANGIMVCNRNCPPTDA